jgi:hypothetical protein
VLRRADPAAGPEHLATSVSASVLVALDTRPPVLTIEAPERIEPPDTLWVRVVADEPLGAVALALLDAGGTLVNLAYERVDERTLVASVPTVGLASGPASLRVSAADTVLNFTRESRTLAVDRPRAHDVELTIDRAYDLVLGTSDGYRIDLGWSHAHVIDLTLDGPYEVILDVGPSHRVNLEIF